MTMQSWIRKLFSRPVRTIRKAPRQLRLALEGLEDRCCPSTFTVTNTLDDGSAGSLRWAVGQANTTTGADTIAFDPTVFSTAKTITLGGTQLELSDTTGATTITGPAAGVTISGNNLSRVFQVDAGVTASLSGLTITGGRAPVDGSLNAAGGGLLNNGTATLTNCTFSGDTAQGGTGGYGNYGNSRGGTGGSGKGGAIFNNSTATLNLTNCTLSGNTTQGGHGGNNYGGAGGTGGSAEGGAIFNNSTATLNLTNCTLSGNTTQGGHGGNPYRGTSGNGGSSAGGAIYTAPASSTVKLKNTIVAGNTASSGPDVSGAFTSQGNNLIGKTDGSSGWIASGASADLTGTSVAPLNPLLAPLGNYSGPTETMALLPGSPAINAGASGTGIPTTDQRGQPRVGATDIGTFESQGFTLTPVGGSTHLQQAVNIGAAFANPLAVTVQATNSVEPVNSGVVHFVVTPAANGAAAIVLDPNSPNGLSSALSYSATVASGQVAISAGPNNTVGSYTVMASVTGSSPAVAFALTNAGPNFSSLVVNTTSATPFAGPGKLSLPLAVFLANSAAGASTITFDPTVFATPQTITLTGQQLELTNTSGLETITGPTAGVTISGAGLSRVFQVDAGATASISGLTIANGRANVDASLNAVGGGLLNNGTATLTKCTFSGDTAQGGTGGNGPYGVEGNPSTGGNGGSGEGGAIFNNSTATLNLISCTLSGNTAQGGTGGNGSNQNNGIGGTGGNGGSGEGGAIFNNSTATMNLTNCTLSGNTAQGGTGGGGGAVNTGNGGQGGQGGSGEGGAISNFSTTTLKLTNCTLSGNTAPGGRGGFGGTARYLHNTGIGSNNEGFSGTGGSGEGGAIFNNSTATLTLTSCTVSGNTAPGGNFDGLYAGNSAGGAICTGQATSTATLINTIVAGNSAGTGPDVSGAFTSQGHNLIGETDGSTSNSWILTGSSADLLGTVAAPLNPLLAPLGNYGGPTQTRALLPGSPAINAGTSGQGIPTTDQRGQPRVGATDIGTFESQGFALTPVAGSTPQTANIGAAFVNPLAVTVTPNNSLEPVNGGGVHFVVTPAANGAAPLVLDPNSPNGVSAALSYSVTVASGQAAISAGPNNTVGSYTVMASATGASAATFSLTNAGPSFSSLVVNTTSAALFAGPGKLSLPLAVFLANSAGVASTITFDSTVFATPQTITLTGQQLELTNTSGLETITGPTGPTAGVTISGNGLSRVFQVDAGVTAALSGLTITGGNSSGLVNSGTATLANCTLSGNSGGGLVNSGTATLTNCTLSGNSGTGLNNSGTATLTNCTLSGNSGTGLNNSGTATLTNTIVDTLQGALAPASSNNLTGGNLLLGSLGNYGGPTQTIPLLPGSPAIDAGTSGGTPSTDQRGKPRVGTTDIGAFESQGFTLTPIAGSTPQTENIGAVFNPLALTVQATNPLEPVNGGVVHFVVTPAANGASALVLDPNSPNGLSGALSYSVTVASGQAAISAGPNNTVGSYTVMASATGASAATFSLTNAGPSFSSLVVNTTSVAWFAGPGKLSLPLAVYLANHAGAASTITFDPTVFATPQTITLTGQQLELTSTSGLETITGPTGPTAGVTISGNGLSRVFQVDAGVSASISGLTITGGSASSGGGLSNGGFLTLTNCTVNGDSASNKGGGLYNNGGTVTLTNCTVSANSASNGGGLWSNGPLTLTNCTVSSNTVSHNGSGGGLWNNFSTLTMANCTISGNQAANNGGGLNNNGGTLTLSNSTISGNSSYYNGGGLYTNATATLTNCTVSSNTGGNGFTYKGSGGGGLKNAGTLTMTNCTVSGNTIISGVSLSYGGGLNNAGTLRLTNCTVSGNSAFSSGGFAGGGGLFNTGTAMLINTIVASQTSGGDINGALAPASSHNLIGGNPLLAPLGSYGGTTQTSPLLPGSPAIDAGTAVVFTTLTAPVADAVGTSITVASTSSLAVGLYIQIDSEIMLITGVSNGTTLTVARGQLMTQAAAHTSTRVNVTLAADQRGQVRGSTFDIGACEIQGFTLTAVTGSTPQISHFGVFPNPLAVTVAANNGLDPVNGGAVSFSVPTTGPSALLTSPVTIAGGMASTTATSNGTSGPYTVTAMASGSNTVSFNLTNDEGGSLVVDTTTDVVNPVDGKTSLREAIAHAEFFGGNQTVTFDPTIFNSPQTIVLTLGPLDLTDATGTITIQGRGADRVLISGNNTSRVFTLYGGSATLRGVTVTGGNSAGNGGALYDNGGTLTLTNCTLSGSSASNGGGLYNNGGTLTLTNCTLSGDSATSSGGGLVNAGTATLINCTVSSNSATTGGGLVNAGTATLTLGNTIVAGNAAGTGSDVSGAITSLGNNLIGKADGSSGWVAADQTGTVAAPLDAQLQPLDIWQTMLPLATSPALDKGNNSLIPAGISTDERGLPRILNGTVDIGAVEGTYNPSFVVNTTSDEFNLTNNLTSLREAIYFANSMPYRTITFDSTVFAALQTITLSGSQLELSDTLGTTTITGPGAGVTISAASLSRVFQVDAGVIAVFSGLTITGGSGGGGVSNGGTLTLTNCTVSGNSAGSNGGGGLANNGGNLTLTNCIVSGNSAGSKGGGLANNSGTLTLTNCTLSGNTVVGPSGGYGQGGAVFNKGTLNLTDCTLSGNSAQGGPAPQFHGPGIGQGGAIFNNGTVNLTSSTLSGNSAVPGTGGSGGGGVGGGIFNKGNLSLTNCTLSGNIAFSNGGGIYNSGSASLTNSTVSSNQTQSSFGYGGGLWNFAPFWRSGGQFNYYYSSKYSATFTLANTIVAGNTAVSFGRGADALGPFLSQGHNLIGSTYGNSGIPFAQTHNAPPAGWTISDLTNVKANLGPLGNYGGPTQTMPLKTGSPAIDAGASGPGIPTTDQRGLPRVGVPDIGAFELQPNDGVTYVVNTTSDALNPGPGLMSLREAVTLANSADVPVTITFDPTFFATPQTITLTGGLLELTDTGGQETITGPAAGVTISGGGLSRVFQIDTGTQASFSGLTITRATLGGQTGVGSAITIQPKAVLTLTDSTLSNNTGLNLYDQGTATLENCTVSGSANAAISVSSGTAVLTNCTISGNGGAGIRNTSLGGGVVKLLNTIVAGNGIGNGVADVFGVFSSLGHNLIGNIGTTTGWLASDLTGTAASPLGLAALGDNGGPTQTIALLPGSKAIGAGADTTLAAPPGGLTISPSATAGSLVKGQTYYYEVTAVNGVGETTASSEVTISLSGSTTSVLVSWTKASGPVVGYNIYRSTASGEEELIGSVAGGTTQFTDTGSGVVGGPPPASNATTLTTDQRGFSRLVNGTLHMDIGAFANQLATPTLSTTQQPATAALGSSIADQATVSGGSNPTGTVTFNLYNNPTGTGTPLFTDTETLSGGVATSANYTTTSAGTDYWVVTYNGDSNNNSVTSGLASAPVTINPATASFSFLGVSTNYDSTSHAASGTATGLNSADLSALLTLAYSTDGGSTFSTSAPLNAGTYEVYYTFNTGAGANPNYQAVSIETDANVQVVISQVSATISVTGYSVPYDGSPHTATGSATGVGGVNLIADLDLSGTTHTNAGSSSDTWTFTDPNGNYYSARNTIIDSIARANATITANSTSKTYGTQLNLGSTAFTTSGFLNGDTPTSVTLTSAGAAATANVAGSPYPITPSAAFGSGLSNYNITYSNGSLTVNRATLTITAVSNIKTYDGTTSAAAIPTYQGLQNSDTVTGLAEAYLSKKVLGANGSTLAVTAYTVNDGSGGNNYTVTTPNASGTINPAPLTVTATGINKIYDGTSAATVTLSDNHIGNDVVMDSYGSASFSDPTVGTNKTVTVNGISISGADAGNYTLQNTTASTTATISSGAPVITSPINGYTSYSTSLSVSGTGTPGNSVQIYDGGTAIGSPVPVNSSGQFSASITLAVGNHTLTATQSGNGLTSDPSSPVNVTVNSIQIDDGTAQRSEVRSITVFLANPLPSSSLPAFLASLSLTRLSDGLRVGLSGTLNSTGTVLTLKFSGSSILGGSLADGRYTLCQGGTALLNGTQLWRLFGDVYGTGQVDSSDQAAFNLAYGTRKGVTYTNGKAYNQYFDYDQNGFITIDSQTAFNQRLGKKLVANGNLVTI